MSSSGKMLKIHSLLNPEDTSASTVTDDSCPPTPSFTATTRELVPPTRLGTPVAPSAAKKQKLAKDAPVFTQGTPLKPVNYEPFESTEDAVTLTNAQQQELRHQHERFGIWPNGRDADGGRIRDYVKHIPYQSEKKGFFAQTGRNAFEGKSVGCQYLGCDAKASSNTLQSSSTSSACPMIPPTAISP